MATRQRQDPAQKIRYLITTTKGELTIEIPASWKVTFGWVNPSAQHGATNGGHCLRVWEGEKLRAVFDNVHNFRDLSIPLARKIDVQTGNTSWTQDSVGNFEQTVKVKSDSTIQLDPGAVFDDGDELVF